MKKTNLIKTANITIILFLIITILPLLSIAQTNNNNDFNPEDPLTWSNNPAEFSKLTESQKEIWNNIGNFDKYLTINDLATKERKFYGLKEPLNELSLVGFESSNLKWKDGFVISDGNVKLDIGNLNLDVTEVEYIPGENGNSKLIYKFKDGRKIVIGSGEIDYNLKYTNENNPSIKEPTEILLNPNENGIISVDKDGKIDYSNGAQVNIDGRVFTQNDPSKPSSVKIIEGGNFETLNTIVKTDQVEITTPTDKLTNVLFNKKKYPDYNQFVRVTDADGKKQVRIVGEDIKVELLKEGLKDELVDVRGNGKNLLVKNGKTLWRINDDNTYGIRRPTKSDVDMDLVNENKPDQLIGTNVEPTTEITDEPVAEIDSPTTEPESTTELNTPLGRKVCIGGSCKSIGIAGGIGSFFGNKPIPIEGPYDDPAKLLVVEKSLLYADEDKVNSFLETLRSEVESSGKKITQQQFMKRLQNYELGNLYGETITQIDLDVAIVDEDLNKKIAEAGFSRLDLNKINEYKANAFEGLKKLPKNTQISLATKKDGDDIIGIIKVIKPGEPPLEPLIIGEGYKIRNMLLKDIRTKSWTSEFLWEKFNDPTIQLITTDN